MTNRVLGHLPDLGPFPRLRSLAGQPALESVLVVPNLFLLRMMEATVFLWTVNDAELFWYPSPDLCLNTTLSQHSTDNSVNHTAWFLLTCTVNCGIYTHVCTFPNHVQSIELTTGGLQSSYRTVSRIINGNRMHLSSISGSEYLHK